MSSNPTTHWWIQKITSLVLLPLCAWLLWAGIKMAGADHAAAVKFMSNPGNAVLATMFVAIGMYHATLGIQTILEDYLSESLGKVLLMVARIGSLVGLLAVIAAGFKLTFGA